MKRLSVLLLVSVWMAGCMGSKAAPSGEQKPAKEQVQAAAPVSGDPKGAVAMAGTLSLPTAGQVIVTEMMIRPSGTGKAEWFELKNTTASELDLTGCQIVVGQTTDTIESGTIGAGAYGIMASRNIASKTEIYIWDSSLSLPDPGGTLRIVCSGTDVDVVNWGNASNPYFTAPEEGFANFLNRNCTSPSCSHQPSKWFSCHPPACVDYGESPNIGTPVAVNPLFPSVAAGAFIITEVSVKPPLADVTKEWFEVLNTTGSMQYLEALQVVQGSNRATIPSTPAIRVPAGEYRVISSATMPTSCGQACRAVYTWGDALSLPDGGGTLSLTASSEVDSVSWVDDPNELFTPVEGKSGYLKSTCRLQSCSNDPGNWASCQPPACVDIGSGYGYGTPGTQNP